MATSKKKIADLKLSNPQKRILAKMQQGLTIVKIAAELDQSYNYTCNMMSVWKEKGWVNRTQSDSGKSIYSLNQKKILV